MAPRTTRSRVSKPSKIASDAELTVEEPKVKLLQKVDNEQRRLFILPKQISNDGRFVSLPHPASSSPTRYLFCPLSGLHEFTRISTPKAAPTSCLIARDNGAIDATPDAHNELARGYVLEDASLYVATPFDPLFLLLPLFVQLQETGRAMSRMADDYIDTLSETSTQLQRMLRRSAFRDMLMSKLAAVSQVQDLGEDTVYKLDLGLLVDALIAKAQRVIRSQSFPASMEEVFVQKPLDVPVTTVHPSAQLLTPEDSQVSIASDSSADASTAKDFAIVPAQSPAPQVTQLMRMKVAFQFLLSSYVPIKLRSTLSEALKKHPSVDFTPLTQHLEKVKAAKAEAQALRSVSDNISRKRGCLDDDEAVEARAEKKRKKDEEELRKKAESRAVKQLKKVDTTGMKKLSSFFTKAPAKAKT